MATFKVKTATSVLLHVILLCGITTTAVQSTVPCSDSKCAVGACVSSQCTECGTGFYLGATACQPCSGDCPDGQFRSAPCDGISDRVCTACSCPENHFVDDIAACDNGATADFSCTPCNVCGDNEYMNTPCGFASDTECFPCGTNPCGTNNYVSIPCTATSDKTCAACKICPRGTYASGGCTGNVDTVCTNCSTSCPAGQYISASCTCESDIECSDCKTCDDDEFECAPCDGIYDRECKDCSTTCPSGYIKVGCSATADRQCAACGCPDGMFEAPGISCGGSVNVNCVGCSICNRDTQYLVRPCQLSEDAQCDTCDECGDGQYETSPCNGITNRKCADCSVGECPDGEYKSADCSETADRQCSPCTKCADGSVEKSPCTPSSNRVCSGTPTTPKPTLLKICQDKLAQGGSVGMRCRKVLCKNVRSLRRSGLCGTTQLGFRPPIGRPPFGRPGFGQPGFGRPGFGLFR